MGVSGVKSRRSKAFFSHSETHIKLNFALFSKSKESKKSTMIPKHGSELEAFCQSFLYH